MNRPAAHLFPLSVQQQAKADDATRGIVAVPMAGARFRVDVDEAALQHAWQLLITRHGSFCARFETTNGTTQQIEDSPPPPIRFIDATSWSETELITALGTVHPDLADLAKGGLYQITVYRCGPQNTVLHLAGNHIVCDMISVGISTFEILGSYLSTLGGVAAALPPPPQHSYSEYVAIQDAFLRSTRGTEMGAWWEKELANVEANPLVRGMTPAPQAQPAHKEASLGFAIDEAGTASIRAAGPNLYRTMLAAHAVMVSALSDSDDIVVGSSANTRPRPDFDGVTGEFSNTIAVRLRVTPEMTFRDVQQHVGEVMKKVSAQREYPFELLSKKLGVADDPGRLFRSYFALITQSAIPQLVGIGFDVEWTSSLYGVAVESIPFFRQGGGDDLGIWIALLENRLLIEMKYNENVFDAGAAQLVAKRFVMLCGALVSNPLAKVGGVWDGLSP